MTEPEYDWLLQICHDCGAKVGELHQLGCDMERCPVCGCQLISCDEDHYDLIEAGKVPRIPYIEPLVICAVCGELFPEFFQVSDEEWDKFVIAPLRDKVLCQKCYEQMRDLFPLGWRNLF